MERGARLKGFVAWFASSVALAHTARVLISVEDKRTLIGKIVAELANGLDIYIKAAQAAHAEATHESSKAENKYDTRGLEASYLARGQSRQAAETAQAIQEFESLELRSFSSDDVIDLAALVQLKSGKERSVYFIGPRAGGTSVVHRDVEVMVITPSSPLGQQIVGRKQGERLKLQIGPTIDEFQIESVA